MTGKVFEFIALDNQLIFEVENSVFEFLFFPVILYVDSTKKCYLDSFKM